MSCAMNFSCNTYYVIYGRLTLSGRCTFTKSNVNLILSIINKSKNRDVVNNK